MKITQGTAWQREFLEQGSVYRRRIEALLAANGICDDALSASLFTDVYFALGRAREAEGRTLPSAYAMMVARRNLWRELAAIARRRQHEVPLTEVNADIALPVRADSSLSLRDLQEALAVASSKDVSIRIARMIVALVAENQIPTQTVVARQLGIDQSTVSRHWKSAGRLLRRLWLN